MERGCGRYFCVDEDCFFCDLRQEEDNEFNENEEDIENGKRETD